MRRMQSPRLAAVETLSQVMRVPEIEVADVRALDAHNAEEVSRRHLECRGVPRRHRELGNLAQLGARLVVKRGVERWQLLERIGQHRRCSAPHRRIWRWCRMCALCQSLNPSLLTAYLRDELRPAVEDRQNLLFFGRGQAHRHAGTPRSRLRRNTAKSLGAPPKVTDSDAGSRPASSAILRKRGMKSSGLPEPALEAAGSIPSP